MPTAFQLSVILLLYSSSECCCLFSTTLINLALNLMLIFVLSAFTAVHGRNPAPPAIFFDPRKSVINYQPQLESWNLPLTSINRYQQSVFFLVFSILTYRFQSQCFVQSLLVQSAILTKSMYLYLRKMHNRHSPNQNRCRMRKLAETANVVISSTKNTSS